MGNIMVLTDVEHALILVTECKVSRIHIVLRTLTVDVACQWAD